MASKIIKNHESNRQTWSFHESLELTSPEDEILQIKASIVDSFVHIIVVNNNNDKYIVSAEQAEQAEKDMKEDLENGTLKNLNYTGRLITVFLNEDTNLLQEVK